MSITYHSTGTAPDELPVQLYTDGAEPWAAIDLSRDGRSYIGVHSPADCDALTAAVAEAKRQLTDAQLRRDGEALGDRIAADEGIEPPADPVPWPTGFCGHQVPPGAWAAGFHHCRDDITAEQRPRFDIAARQLSAVDDEDGEQR